MVGREGARAALPNHTMPIDTDLDVNTKLSLEAFNSLVPDFRPHYWSG